MPSRSRLSTAGCAAPVGPWAKALSSRVVIASTTGALAGSQAGSSPQIQYCVPAEKTAAPLGVVY
jgi:hypothetical protein